MKMFGNNKMILSQETMIVIVQEWLERNMVNFNSQVDFVYKNNKGFEISLYEKVPKKTK